MNILSGDLSDKLWNICPSFRGICGSGISRCFVLSPSSVSSCVYTFPDPRPTGPLKMQEEQGGGMFNACSPLPPLGPLLLSQDTVCTDRTMAAKGVKDNTHWRLWGPRVGRYRRCMELMWEQDGDGGARGEINKTPLKLTHESCFWISLHWEWQI